MFSPAKVVHLKTNFVFPNGFIYNSKWRVRAVAATLETRAHEAEAACDNPRHWTVYCQESLTMGSSARIVRNHSQWDLL